LSSIGSTRIGGGAAASGFFSGFGLAIGFDYRYEVIAREKPMT